MISADDIADIILGALREGRTGPLNYRKALSKAPERQGLWGFHAAQAFNKSYTSLPAKRIFLSEYDVKKLMKPGDKKLKVPKTSILSPLVQEWLETKGVTLEYY